MCAQNFARMQQTPVHTFNSSATPSRTKVLSPIATRDTSFIEQKTEAASPIVRTSDSEGWANLDIISPKLFRELQRQYDASITNEKGPLAKGAAKLKAWTRQTKSGFDIRLRRKINSECDEVTDFQLVRDPLPMEDKKALTLPEAPGDVLFEMPDTSVVPELSAVASDEGHREPANYLAQEPLPRYEPPASATQPRLQIGPTELDASSNHVRSPSESSIVVTPTAGLSRKDDLESIEKAKSTEQPLDQIESSQTIQGGDAQLGQLDPSPTIKESIGDDDLQQLVDALKEQLARQTPQLEVRQEGAGRLKLAKFKRYETDTDAEAPNPSLKNLGHTYFRNSSSRKKVGTEKKLRVRKDQSKRQERQDLDGEPDPSLPRRLTVAKRIRAEAGAEAIWSGLLEAQSKLLGPEHPLVLQARHALSLSRVREHHQCAPKILDPLHESETVATRTLGKVHPLVEAFSADLETLSSLIIAKDSLLDAYECLANEESTSTEITGQGVPMSSPVQVQPQHDETATVFETPKKPNSSEGLNIQPALPDVHAIPEDDSVDELVSRDDLWNTSRPPHRPKSDMLVLSGLVFATFSGVVKECIRWLELNYGPEPMVQPGQVRVRWTCSCGDQLFDDFIERRPGAARELEAYLNRPQIHTRAVTPTSPTSSAGSHNFAGSFNASLASLASSNTSYSNFDQGSFGRNSKGSNFTTSLPRYSSFISMTEPPWLLTCTNEDCLTPKVSHLDVSPHRITSDKDLANTLRSHYSEVNGKWWKHFKLRGLTTIQFVQFECHQNKFADIRKCPDMPPHGKSDYTFEPGELMPPVGSQYLLHLFKHPEDYDGELIAYLRVPKKTGRLNLGVGWGVHLVEGILPTRVWVLANVFFTLVSLVFAIAWICERHDVQGAFGVAQWICTLGVFAGGWLQAYIG